MARTNLHYILKIRRKMGVKRASMGMSQYLHPFTPILNPFYAQIWDCNPGMSKPSVFYFKFGIIHKDSLKTVFYKGLKLREKISLKISWKIRNFQLSLKRVIFHIFGIFWVGGACQHPLAPKSAKIQKNHTFTQNSLF